MNEFHPDVPKDVRLLAEQLGKDPEKWRHNCHSASLAIVQSGLFPGARVARGWADGVPGAQHSWVVLGRPGKRYRPDEFQVYDRAADVLDPTLWSYDETVTSLWRGPNLLVHKPHGMGSIWEWGRPNEPTGPVVELTPTFELSRPAKAFLEAVGPLDRDGWATLTAAPCEDWASGEILAAMDDTEELSALVPIDKLGMLSDKNPGGLYLPAKEA